MSLNTTGLYDKGVKDGDPMATITFIIMSWVMFQWFSIPGAAPFSQAIVSSRFGDAVVGSRFLLILLIPLGLMMFVHFFVEKLRDEPQSLPFIASKKRYLSEEQKEAIRRAVREAGLREDAIDLSPEGMAMGSRRRALREMEEEEEEDEGLG